MISSMTEYQKAREELEHLTHWLSRLENEKATTRKGLTVASIRKMISRLQVELSEYEMGGISTPSAAEEQIGPKDNRDEPKS